MKKARPVPKPKAKPAAKSAPARRAPAPQPVEHRLAVAGIAVIVAYASVRAEQFELRGAATVNASAATGVRTTGIAAIVLRKGARADNRVSYDPASFNRNLVFALSMDEADFTLFHDLFVKNPGGYDPGLRLWARTAKALRTDASDSQPVLDFGYRLDLVQTPTGPR